MSCDAKIKPFPMPSKELTCGLEGEHEQHVSVLKDYAYPGSVTTVVWMEHDRRTYHGEWPGHCDGSPTCVLPTGHRGNHIV